MEGQAQCMYDNESIEIVKQSDKELKRVMKFRYILKYNKEMVKKGNRKLLFYMSDMVLNMAWIIIFWIKEYTVEKGRHILIIYRKYSRSNFTKCPIIGLQNTGKLSLDEMTLRLQQYWTHFPKNIDSTFWKKNPTRMCYKYKIRSEIEWECTKCKVSSRMFSEISSRTINF